MSQPVRDADALVLITPEWGGMATPIMKNFLLMCGLNECAHKPALLVSVVSGISGAYPIAELRMNATKNIKLVAVPDHLIIRDCTEVLNSAQAESPRDSRLRDRVDYSLHMLHQYAKALKPLREEAHTNPHPNQGNYPYGM
ncbi:hypothetical protein GCM10025776_34920 [Corallincola platygyrae]